MNSLTRNNSLLLSFIIMYLCMVLVSSCQSEQYKMQLQRNISLKSQLNSVVAIDDFTIIHFLKKNISEAEIWGSVFYCEVPYYKCRIFNLNQFGKEHQKYSSVNNLYMYYTSCINVFEYKKVNFTIPTKNKNTESQKKIYSSKKYFTFIPTDTGMNYWSGALVIINERDGRQTEFPIYDSIYVLGN